MPRSAPADLLVDGEAAIGKTTPWLAGLQRARDRGFRVLSARTAEAEFRAGIRVAGRPVDRRGTGHVGSICLSLSGSRWTGCCCGEQAADAVTDRRAVAAAFLSVVDRLADDGRVLLAIDDLQWLDPSTVHVIAFTARRLSGPVGLLATVRTERDSGGATSWLQLPRPDAIHRIAVRPLSSSALTPLCGKADSADTACSNGESSPDIGRKSFLRHRIGRAHWSRASMRCCPRHSLTWCGRGSAALSPRYTTCCLPLHAWPSRRSSWSAKRPQTTMTADRAPRSRRAARHRRHRRQPDPVHPSLLAGGVYTDASPEQRRLMHRRLAGVVDELELRARHLALASTTDDPEILEVLDAAAASAQARGAPAAGATTRLAIELGGTPQNVDPVGGACFDGGDPGRARALLERAIARMQPDRCARKR